MREHVMTAFVDSHTHLRQGAMMKLVVPWVARHFARCLPMPNRSPPLVTGASAIMNRDEIQAIEPRLEVIPTIYLTSGTTPEMIHEAANIGVRAAKAYFRDHDKPGTTNAHHGLLVDDISKMYDVFVTMRERQMVLCEHMELPYGPWSTRERLGITIHQKIRAMAPDLKIVIEHVSDPISFQAFKDDPYTAFTITPHHLWNNADHARGNHHLHCMPVVKDEDARRGLCMIAMSGHERVFCGTDAAPHDEQSKNRAEGPPAGAYTQIAAVDCYATTFENANALDHRFEAFMSLNGPRFYGMDPSTRKVRLWIDEEDPEIVPDRIMDGEIAVVPHRHGERLRWKAEMLD